MQAPPATAEQTTETTSHTPEVTYVSGWRLFLVASAIVMTIFLARLTHFERRSTQTLTTAKASLDLTILATAVPKITQEFNSLDYVGWYASTLFLTVAAGQCIWAKAFKLFDIKRVYLVSIAVFELGSLICGIARNNATFIAGRAITGLGVAGTFSGSYVINGVCTAPKTRAAMTGLTSAAYAIAAAVGPVIGGALTDKVSWRWCFFINLPCGAAAGIAVIAFLRLPGHAKAANAPWKRRLVEFDFAGFLLIVGSVLCLMLALQWGGVTKRWASSDVVGTLAGAAVLACLFSLNEWQQGERALVMRSFLRGRTFAVGCAIIFLLAGSFYILLYYLPIYFQAVKGADAVESGIRSLPLILGLTVVQIVVGVAIGALGLYNQFLIAGCIMATVAAGLLTELTTSSSARVWIGYQALAGIGLGGCLSVPIIVTQARSAMADVAPATAIVLFFQSLGGAVIITAAQAVFQNGLVRELKRTAPAIDIGRVLSTGATGIERAFSGDERVKIDGAYLVGIRQALYLAIATGALATLLAFSQKWETLSMKRD